MKLACIADVHASNWKEFSKTLQVRWDDKLSRYVEGEDIPMNSRLFNILSALSDVKEHCLKNRINNVLCAGDVFHSRAILDVSVFNAVHNVIRSFADNYIKILFIPGNHDQVSNGINPENSLATLDGFHSVVTTPGVVIIQDGRERVEVVVLPYSKDAKANVSFVQNSASRDRILMAHLGVSGAEVGSSNFIMTDEYSLTDLVVDKYMYTVLGHYHKPQLLTDTAFYCGSPVPNTFNDTGDYGFWVIDTEGGEPEFHVLDYPRFVTLDDTSDFSKVAFNSFVRVRSKTGETPDVNVEGVRVEIEKEYSPIGNSKIDVSMSEEQVIKQYVDENPVDGVDPVDLLRKGLEFLVRVKG